MAISVNFIGDGKVTERWRYGDAFDPAKHPRGQPENKGEFASVSGGGQSGIKVEPEDPSSPERLAWNILLNGKKIGRATATGGADGDFLDAVRIDQEHQNKGYSTEIYNQIEQHLGHKLLPSPLGLSPQATAVWKRRLAKLTPEQRLDIVNRSKVIGREFGLRDEHLNNRLDPLLGEPDAAGEIAQGREATGAEPGASDFSRHKLAPIYYLATSTSISPTNKIASLKDKLNNSFYDDDDKSYIRGWLDYLQAQQAATAPHVTVTGDVPVTKLGGGNSVPRPEPEPLDDYKYATQSNEEFKAETGIDVIRDPDSHVLRNTGETRKLIAGLPASHRALLKNTKFYTKGVISTSGLNMAVKADSYVGLYDRANDTITVADGYKLPDGTTALASAPYYAIAAHEIGHAIDLKLGNALSDDPEVIRLLNRDENRLTPAQSRAASYYMQDKREIVAECYAMLFAPSARAFNMPFHVAQECFFRTLFGLKQALHRNGLDTYE